MFLFTDTIQLCIAVKNLTLPGLFSFRLLISSSSNLAYRGVSPRFQHLFSNITLYRIQHVNVKQLPNGSRNGLHKDVARA
jgi:hypothetical protein